MYHQVKQSSFESAMGFVFMTAPDFALLMVQVYSLFFVLASYFHKFYYSLKIIFIFFGFP